MLLRGTLHSKTLEMDTGIAVLVPDGFTGLEPRRVCYLLHGLHGSSGNFVDYTQLLVYGRRYQCIFVMPEVARSFYTDMRRGQKFFTYVTEELPETCSRVFRVGAAREDTSVIGGSMGGYGALKCALRRPELYGSCAALAPALLFLREALDGMRSPQGAALAKAAYGEQLYIDFLAAFGDDLAWDAGNDIAELVRRTEGLADKPRLYVACGREDDLIRDNRRFRDAMKDLRHDFTFEEWPGGHDWPFFDAALRRALEWCYGRPPEA